MTARIIGKSNRAIRGLQHEFHCDAERRVLWSRLLAFHPAARRAMVEKYRYAAEQYGYTRG
jgi:hypothetical protein